ncbi:gem associated protein 5 [Entomortierella parvispora]|uniref:Gem associated protein 5 n=1 Tax=Entomortierella parvispora TaxID=205924 RepID=A0A9P3H9L1_9FUNG|nr:gem associated protein 5 [Entomortierella parvispora]
MQDNMDDVVFPPSPQWHQAHSASLCALSKDKGWMLYSLNSSIHILNPFSMKYEGILSGFHTGRINSVASVTVSIPSLATVSTGSLTHKIATPEGMGGVDHSMSSSPSKTVLVVSGGEDQTVVCWDLASRKPLAVSRAHNKPVTAVEWTSNGKTIISGDQSGLLVAWDPFSGKIVSKQLDKMAPMVCIVASPTRKNIVAIGLDGGDILICDATCDSIDVICRLHGHTTKVQSLAWQPSSSDDASGPTPQKYTLLASGSADQTIRIWDVENGVCNKVIDMPDQHEERGPSNFAKLRTWVPVGWILGGTSILSSSSRGNMYRFSIDGNRNDGVRITLGRQHIRQVFQVLVWPTGTFAFTISLDRRIVAWDLEKGEGVAQIDCIGGAVHSLDISPMEPGVVAMGLGSETIKIWNTLSQSEPYETMMVDRLQSRVRVIKWHPTAVGTLCFGLESGKIGMVENMSPNLQHQLKSQSRGKKGKKNNRISPTSTIFQAYHQRAVVSMQWCSPKALEAPVPELFDLALKDSSFCILSCGVDGRILVSNPSKPNSKSLDLDVVIHQQNREWYQSKKAVKGSKTCNRSDFHIHPNEDLIAIGNTDGSVEVFELKYFKLVFVFQGHSSKVNRVRWNISGGDPDSPPTAGREAVSYLLASGFEHGALNVHNLAQYSSKAMAINSIKRSLERHSSGEASIEAPPPTTLNTEPVLPTAASFASLRHHTRSISNIAWSPHDGNDDDDAGPTQFQKLVTSSYDGRVVVYQLYIGDLLAGVSGHSSVTPGADSKESGGGISSDTKGDGAEDSSMEDDASVTSESLSRSERRCHRPIACLNLLGDQALSVHWSLSDVDRIYSGGNDWRLISWNWKAHPFTKAKRIHQDRETATRQSNEPGSKSSPAPCELSSRVEVSPSVQSEQTDASSTVQSSPEAREVYSPMNKRTLEAPESPNPSKRHRSPAAISPSPAVTTNPTNQQVDTASKLRLFPKSGNAFQKVKSKKKTCLEVIRLARNLYCRHRRHRGILNTDADIDEARVRWQAMLAFLRKDGDPEGIHMALTLCGETDEMNIQQDEDDEKEEPAQPAAMDKNGELNTGDIIQETEETEDEDIVFDGDLVFYGSRESVKALAELEAQEIAKTPGNVFTTASGLGVPLPVDAVISSRRNPSSGKTGPKTQNSQQLCRIPVAFWMGDVPQMIDILGSLQVNQFGIQDWIGLALAPMGGVDAWRQLMAKTATKFTANSEAHAAALCYLALGKVFAAVEAYRKCCLYREALMLFRIRMWDDADDDGEDDYGNGDVEGPQGKEGEAKDILDPSSSGSSSLSKDPSDLHRRILTEWGQALEKKGQYEQACKCHLALEALLVKRNRKARRGGALARETSSVGLQTLARRHDLISLRTVAAIAILIHDPSAEDYIGRHEEMWRLKQETEKRKKN